MKRTIAAILALAPAMLVAQSATPAQPSSTPVLQSALLQPVLFSDSKASSSSSSEVSARRISTGVVAPQLVKSAPFLNVDHAIHALAADRTIIVQMTVSEAGVPTDLHLVEPIEPAIADKVLASVSQFRYKPGTLDGRPTAVPVRLQYRLVQGSTY